MLSRPRDRDVRRLSAVRGPWCVTVYGTADDWSRGNHLTPGARAQLHAVVERLQHAGAPEDVVAAIRARLEQHAVAPAEAAGVPDPHMQAVALFATPTDLEAYALTTAPSPWVGTGDRFLIGPLLEGLLGLRPPVVVLALSEAQVRLVDVSARPIAVLDVPGLPQDLADALDLDLTNDRQTLAHRRTAEDAKGRLRQYARAIDRALGPVLRHDEPLLVIAAAEPLAGIFRAVTRYPLVASTGITGNHDGDSPFELAELAGPAIEHYRRSVVEEHLARFAELPARGRVSTELSEIAENARDRTLDTLFVDVDHRVPVAAETSFGPVTIDAVDEIVRAALDGGATIVPVRAVDLPTTDPVAAVLRYARRTVPSGGHREG
jgi:hypothetical protein